MEIVRTLESLEIFFAQFGLSVVRMNARDIASERYFRGHCDLIRGKCSVPASVTIERAFDDFKTTVPELENFSLTFGGLTFIIK